MKYLITGGAGFIGSSLTERLLRRGDKIVCVDNFNDFYDPAVKRKNIKSFLDNGSYKLVETDIRDFEKIKKIICAGGFDCVVHFAARAGVRPSIIEPELYKEVNVGGTTNILEACRDADCKKIVSASSSSVYGNYPEVPFSEDMSPLAPASPYGFTKLRGEEICRKYWKDYGIKSACLRFFTVYGPRQRPEMAIHKFIRRIISGKQIEIFGLGSSSRDYTYIDDIIDGVIAVIDKDFDFEIFNLGDSSPVNILDLVKIIEKAVGKEAKIKFASKQEGDVERTFADITKASKELNYYPKVSIEEGVRRFVEWIKSSERRRKDAETSSA